MQIRSSKNSLHGKRKSALLNLTWSGLLCRVVWSVSQLLYLLQRAGHFKFFSPSFFVGLEYSTKRSILKKLGLVSNSVPANGSYRSEEPFYFFSALKAGFENLVQKQQLKPGSIVVLLVGLPWSADLSRQLLARLGKPEAVAAFLTVDLPQDQDSSYPLDLHLTAKGHAEMANRIIKVIRDRCYLNQKADEDENIHCGSFITIL